ncbi:MAG: pilus assembly protein PilM [Sarcina sp.]
MVGKLDEVMQTGIEQKDIDIETSKPVVKKKRKIKKLPKINDIKLVSIDIGSKYIKILEAKKKKDVIQITSALKIESPADIIEKGELRNIPAITNAIKMALMKWHIGTKDISFTSIAGSVMSREITIADTDEITVAERQMLVENELRQYLPINLADYQIQFTDAGKVEDKDGITKQRVLVIVYPIKLIKNFLSVISESGSKLRPCSLDITNNSLQKFFNHVKTINGKAIEREKAHLFIDMGRNTFNTSIIADGKLQFMRTVEASQDEIDRAIGLRIGKHYDEAEILKIEQCDLMGENLTDEQLEINDVTKSFVNKWIEDIARINQFYGSKEQQRVEKIYIYGGGAKLKGLAQYMQDRLELETERIETFDGIDLGKNINVGNIDQFINTLGTVIRF